MDRTDHDALAFYLAFAHPALGATALLLAGVALRAGLALRRRRRLRLGGDAAGRRRHLAWSKPAVALVAVAAVGGPLSSWWLRGWTPFERVHGWVALTALALFLAAAGVGHRLEHGETRRFDLHAALGLAAFLAGALAAATGFVLLP